ncbi:hypothetical protein BJ742DRAFT_783373 [Cladochytrium replicatum]|nr:hypothetical protein BJ742DRAFT_783373 [Cladochytrium replicatum]
MGSVQDTAHWYVDIQGLKVALSVEKEPNSSASDFTCVVTPFYPLTLLTPLSIALFGATINGPYYYYAFRIIDRVVGTSVSVSSVVIKAISSQTFFSPPYLATFLAYTGYFEGANPVDRVQSRFVELYTSSWMIWPFVNVVNFKYMKPGVPRILFMNVLGVAWNVYMSWVSQRDAIAGQNGLGPPSSSPPKPVVV